jgi:hypothetical protein
MTMFDTMETCFEKKFAYDNEMKFKITCKRNNLIASWAADILHYEGNDKNEYISSVIDLSVHDTRSKALSDKIIQDLENTTTNSNELDVCNKMNQFMLEARKFYQ